MNMMDQLAGILRTTGSRLLATSLIVGCLFCVSIGAGQTKLGNAFQQHTDRVRNMLPKHSGLPPLLDLSKPDTSNTQASRAWEKRFTGSMGVREHTDPGIQYPSSDGSVTVTTTDFTSPANALPVDALHTVIVARPMSANSHMAYNSRFVYSTFSLEILKVLKGLRNDKIQEGKRIIGAQLGGSIRYPSGHVETFLLSNDGFVDIGKSYFLFIWKPIRSDNTYMIEQAYLIQGDCVFPVDAHASAYDGMNVKEFEAKTNEAIAKIHKAK